MSKKKTDEMNTVLAFTEWLNNNNEHNYIFVSDGFGDDNECLCIAGGNRGKMIATLASGMLEHDDLDHIVFKAATAVIKYKYDKMLKNGVNIKEVERDIEDMLFDGENDEV